MNEKNRDWMSAGEAARALGISARTVLRMIERGALAAWRWDGRARWRISREAVERILRNTGTIPPDSVSE